MLEIIAFGIFVGLWFEFSGSPTSSDDFDSSEWRDEVNLEMRNCKDWVPIPPPRKRRKSRWMIWWL